MTTICLLLLGACGSASRTITVEPSKERIVVRVVMGGIRDVFAGSTASGGEGLRIMARLEASRVWSTISLRIDGTERTGVLAWISAANRVAGYALGRQSGGSVEYSYWLWLFGLDIRRATRIEDGRVSLVTDVWGRIGPKGELYRVHLVLSATEWRGATSIHGFVVGCSEIGERCAVVSRIASRVISRELDQQLLAVIERGGRRLYRNGDLHQIVIEFIKNLKESDK